MSVAYEKILARIVSGTDEPGKRLREAGLAEELKTSRTPVREALQRLAAEGHVTIIPNRGATVSVADGDDLEELFELRMLLEGFAAGLAAQRIDEPGLKRLKEIQQDFERAAASSSPEEMSRINLAFHRAVVDAAQNSRLATFISTLTSASLARATFETYSDEQLARSVSQHRQLIEGMERHDRPLAEMAMKVHISGARNSLKNDLQARRIVKEESSNDRD
ncbi:GntR family transcriptional regulator [Glaciibacter superstes]|uniref:GntR family transcriptional regulator n=1 Tax=Glaciibacter superstes TaxID=501023 RepID=UPI00041B7076|nr:GntR family transcriptional regulator [Glaciibacter superstes]